jgi:hypothetical protein
MDFTSIIGQVDNLWSMLVFVICFIVSTWFNKYKIDKTTRTEQDNREKQFNQVIELVKNHVDLTHQDTMAKLEILSKEFKEKVFSSSQATSIVSLVMDESIEHIIQLLEHDEVYILPNDKASDKLLSGILRQSQRRITKRLGTFRVRRGNISTVIKTELEVLIYQEFHESITDILGKKGYRDTKQFYEFVRVALHGKRHFFEEELKL